MDEKALAASINAAINELIKTGPTAELLTRWRAELERNLEDAATSPQNASDALRRYYQDFLDRIIQCRGMPVREIASTSVEQDTRLKGVRMDDNFEFLEPKIRHAFDVCVKRAEDQAKSFRQRQISDALDTFCEWAHSIPDGGTKEKSFREDARDVRNELKAASKWDKYYSQEKSRNFLNAVNRIEAEGNGAIAAEWHCTSWANEEEHQKYCGKVYLVRGNWASENGFIDDSKAAYIDEIPNPGDDGCMCTHSYLFSLNSLPPEFITSKGVDAIATSKKAQRKAAQGKEASPMLLIVGIPAAITILIMVAVFNIWQRQHAEVSDSEPLAVTPQVSSDELRAANARILRSSPTETAIPDTKADIAYVSINDLASEYDANEVATDEKYQGMTLHVFGKIHSIEKDFRDKIIVSLETSSGLGHALMDMTDDQKALVMQLNKGDTITLECEKFRRVLGSPSGSKCRIISDNKQMPTADSSPHSKPPQLSNLSSNEEIHKKGQAALNRKDYREALRMFSQAAQNGSAEGQTSLGAIYANGFGVATNYQEAMRLFQQAADAGFARAQYSIGVMYACGDGVKVDYVEAMRWYRKAADQGYAPAQTAIGTLYQYGAGVAKDDAQARNWYDLAAGQGFEPATRALTKLAEPSSTETQISQTNQN